MDRSSAGFWLLTGSICIPALIGIIEARQRGRGILGLLVNVVAAVAAGFALTFAVVTYGETVIRANDVIGMIALFVGIIGGALLALRVLNRFRR